MKPRNRRRNYLPTKPARTTICETCRDLQLTPAFVETLQSFGGTVTLYHDRQHTLEAQDGTNDSSSTNSGL